MQADAVRRGALLAALLGLAAPAAAEERPVFPPARDVAVTYRLNSSQATLLRTVVLRYSAATDRFRLEGALPGTALPGYALVDRKAGHATIVIERLGMMMDAPPRAGLDQAFLLETGKHFVRKASETVAGLRCTVWDVAGDSASGAACVTADGVVLRASGHDNKGRTGSIEATQVEYGHQAAALFFPPADARKVDLAGLLSGPAAAAVLGQLRGRGP